MFSHACKASTTHSKPLWLDIMCNNLLEQNLTPLLHSSLFFRFIREKDPATHNGAELLPKAWAPLNECRNLQSPEASTSQDLQDYEPQNISRPSWNGRRPTRITNPNEQPKHNSHASFQQSELGGDYSSVHAAPCVCACATLRNSKPWA